VPEPAPESPSTDSGGNSKAGLWIGLVLIVLLIAGVAAWYLGLFSDTEPDIEKPPQRVTKPTQPVPHDPVLSGRPRAQAFLSRAPAPNAKEMLTQFLAWEKAGDCEAAMIVLNMAAGADAAASMEMAQRYDPATARKDGCITAADPETAAYWYEGPAEQGDVKAQSRLGILLTEGNRSGPLYDRGLKYLRDASKAGDNPARERLRELGE
jgi:hypothetical protein